MRVQRLTGSNPVPNIFSSLFAKERWARGVTFGIEKKGT